MCYKGSELNLKALRKRLSLFKSRRNGTVRAYIHISIQIVMKSFFRQPKQRPIQREPSRSSAAYDSRRLQQATPPPPPDAGGTPNNVGPNTLVIGIDFGIFPLIEFC